MVAFDIVSVCLSISDQYIRVVAASEPIRFPSIASSVIPEAIAAFTIRTAEPSSRLQSYRRTESKLRNFGMAAESMQAPTYPTRFLDISSRFRVLELTSG